MGGLLAKPRSISSPSFGSTLAFWGSVVLTTMARYWTLITTKCGLKKAILDNSRCVMLAADHTKFGRNAMVNLGNITQLDMVFTDVTPPAQIREMLAAQGSHLEVISHAVSEDTPSVV